MSTLRPSTTMALMTYSPSVSAAVSSLVTSASAPSGPEGAARKARQPLQTPSGTSAEHGHCLMKVLTLLNETLPSQTLDLTASR